jgi:hypothetical protein
LFNVLILGLGPLVANRVGTWFEGAYALPGGGFDFEKIFTILCGAALVSAAILFLFFHPPAKKPVPEEAPVTVP